MRKAEHCALPAYVASAACAIPKVAELDAALAKAALLKEGDFRGAAERRLQAAAGRFREKLAQSEADQVARIVEAIVMCATVNWDAKCRGQPETMCTPRAQWAGIAPAEPVVPAGGGNAPVAQGPAVTGEEEGKAESHVGEER